MLIIYSVVFIFVIFLVIKSTYGDSAWLKEYAQKQILNIKNHKIKIVMEGKLYSVMVKSPPSNKWKTPENSYSKFSTLDDAKEYVAEYTKWKTKELDKGRKKYEETRAKRIEMNQEMKTIKKLGGGVSLNSVKDVIPEEFI